MNAINKMLECTNKFAIFYKQDTLCIKYFGEIDNDDLTEISSYFVDKNQFQQVKHVVWDFSDVSYVSTNERSANILTSCYRLFKSLSNQLKTAYITDDGRLMRAIYKHTQVLMETENGALPEIYSSLSDYSESMSSLCLV